MWKKYFNIKGIKPGEVQYPAPFGRVDFRNENLDPNLLLKICEKKLPYIELSEEGKKHFSTKIEPKNESSKSQ
jgi:hypothetical protein